MPLDRGKLRIMTIFCVIQANLLEMLLIGYKVFEGQRLMTYVYLAMSN